MTTVSLSRLILGLCTVSLLAATANSLYVGYRVQRDALLTGTLESNRAQALQLADAVNSMLLNADGTLAYSALVLGGDFSDRSIDREAHRVQAQGNYFNSVVIVDRDGIVRATAPPELGLTGHRIQSAGAKEALAKRAPLVSSPYVSATGRWIGSLSHPIFSGKKTNTWAI